MTINYSDIANLVSALTKSVGCGEIKPDDALEDLSEALEEQMDFSEVTAIWQLSNRSNDVLALILPEKSDVFVAPGDRSGPVGTEPLSLDWSVRITIRAIMRGLNMFDTDQDRKHGACELLKHCPNPIEESATPFVDAKGQWDHTHKRAEN